MTSSRACRNRAASSRWRSKSPACRKRLSPADRRDPPAVPFDPSIYLRLDAQGSLGSSAAGVAFATSTGDVLEVANYGPGTFRLRVGSDSKPDYGIVEGHPQSCAVSRERAGTWVLN